MKLLDGATVDGDGTVFNARAAGSRYTSDVFTFYAWGTWGGGTVKLMISPDNTNWFDVTNAAFTADGVLNVQFRAPYVKANLAGSSGANLTAFLM